MFSNKSRFSLQSDSQRTLIWRVPCTRYHQENTIEQHRYGGAGWLIWGEIFLVPELRPKNCRPSTPSHLSTGTSEGIA
ncbi:DDE_3 domain-containing protein [Trichonephila clavipes]|nr:DDE_3 domain-containing protein [Trichonephila clavipes]